MLFSNDWSLSYSGHLTSPRYHLDLSNLKAYLLPIGLLVQKRPRRVPELNSQILHCVNNFITIVTFHFQVIACPSLSAFSLTPLKVIWKLAWVPCPDSNWLTFKLPTDAIEVIHQLITEWIPPMTTCINVQLTFTLLSRGAQFDNNETFISLKNTI